MWKRLIGKLSYHYLNGTKKRWRHARTFTINTSMFRLGLTPQGVRLLNRRMYSPPPEEFWGYCRMPLLVRVRLPEVGKILPKCFYGYDAHLAVVAPICPSIWAFKLTSCSRVGWVVVHLRLWLGAEWNRHWGVPDLSLVPLTHLSTVRRIGASSLRAIIDTQNNKTIGLRTDSHFSMSWGGIDTPSITICA